MKRLKVKKIIPILLMVIFIIATFGGCTTGTDGNPSHFADHKEGFYGELAKISKEVEGYALVETEEKQEWTDSVIIQKNGKECEMCGHEGLVYINGEMLFINDYYEKSEALCSIDSIVDRLENNNGWRIMIYLHGVKIFDNKVFIIASCLLEYKLYVLPTVEVKEYRAPLLFEYDIEQDALRYAGYADKGIIEDSGGTLIHYIKLNIVKL